MSCVKVLGSIRSQGGAAAFKFVSLANASLLAHPSNYLKQPENNGNVINFPLIVKDRHFNFIFRWGFYLVYQNNALCFSTLLVTLDPVNNANSVFYIIFACYLPSSGHTGELQR